METSAVREQNTGELKKNPLQGNDVHEAVTTSMTTVDPSESKITENAPCDEEHTVTRSESSTKRSDDPESSKKRSSASNVDSTQIIPDGVKRLRKKREFESFETPIKRKNKKLEQGGGLMSAMFVDVTASTADADPEANMSFDEKRRRLLERLNHIEKIKKVKAAEPQEAFSVVAQATSSPQSTTVARSLTVNPKINQDSVRYLESSLSEGALFSPSSPGVEQHDVAKANSDIQPKNAPVSPESSNLPKSDRVLRSPSARTARLRTPSVLISNQPGEFIAGGVPKDQEYQFLHCKSIVKKFMSNKDAAAFCAPVDELWPPEAIPNYFEVITKPMDFRTILRNLDSGNYLQPKENETASSPGSSRMFFNSGVFAEDARLVFRNAMLFNAPGDFYYETAKNLLTEFEENFEKLPLIGEVPTQSRRTKSGKLSKKANKKTAKENRKLERARKAVVGSVSAEKVKVSKKVRTKAPKVTTSKEEITSYRDEELEMLSTRELETKLAWLRHRQKTLENPAHSPLASPKSAASYTQKGQALAHIPMSYEEKKRLRDSINTLNYDKLSKLLQIYSKHSGPIVKDHDEIEIEIDKCSNLGLREMEAFVESVTGRGKKCKKTIEGQNGSTRKDLEIQIEFCENLMKKRRDEAASKADSQIVAASPLMGQFESDSDSDSDSDSGSESSEFDD